MDFLLHKNIEPKSSTIVEGKSRVVDTLFLFNIIVSFLLSLARSSSALASRREIEKKLENEIEIRIKLDMKI